MTTPIQKAMDRIDWRCTRCCAPMGTCDCAPQCACGWFVVKGEQCRNEVHRCPRETETGRCIWEVGHTDECEGPL